MAKRILVAVVFVPVIFLVIYALPAWGIPAALACICALAVYEVLVATGFLKHERIPGYSMALAALIPFWVYFGSDLGLALAALFLYTLVLFCEAMASHRKVGLEQVAGAFFAAVFIPFFLSSFVRLRNMEHWEFLILLPFIVAFLSDAFALFAGLLWGRHKLAPDLSPKKTVEGAVGGLLGAMASAALAGLIFQVFFQLEGIRYPVLVFYGALGSLVSQLGDLSFSYIKREYGIKDFGKVLPGHGGVLDRFDSVIFCAPLIEVLIELLPVVR